MVVRTSKRTLRLKHLLAAHAELIANGGRLRNHSAGVGGVGGQFATYLPPESARVPGLMNDLLAHVMRPSAKDLLTATVSMVRLLQIHPFPDGNGRTARLLFVALLASAYGWRPVFADLLACLFRSGNHELLLASIEQQRSGDWTAVLALYQRLVAG